MADFNPKPTNHTHQDMQIHQFNDPNPKEFDPPRDFRSYSVSYASSYKYPQKNMDIVVANDLKLKKGKSVNGSVTKGWSFGDAEFQRKKRVAGYKVYSVEGKVKGSFRKSFRWIKDKYNHVVYG